MTEFIYVVIKDQGCEGYDLPLGIYDNLELAKEIAKATKDSMGTTCIVEYEINKIKD